jgi:hypothetical protein
MGPFKLPRRLFSLVFGGIVLFPLPVFGGEEGPASPDPQGAEGQFSRGDEEIRVVRGRVRLVGSSPFIEMVISDEDGFDWYLEPGEGKILEDYQQRIITVRGKVRVQELFLANGAPLGSRRILRDVSLVSP